MADYFSNFSLIVPLPTEAAQAHALELIHQASQGQQGEELPADFPPTLKEFLEDWTFETEANDPAEGHGLWLHSMYGGVDAACAFIQHLLQKFDPQGRVEFEWSNDCSKPRVDAYGGGAAIVTANEIKTLNTGQWLAQNAG